VSLAGQVDRGKLGLVALETSLRRLGLAPGGHVLGIAYHVGGHVAARVDGDEARRRDADVGDRVPNLGSDRGQASPMMARR
jgi:hypothetical protein